MRIAVLSGKGGTGKTFVSVNLAYTKGKAVYIDCDVEEPNGRLFLKPEAGRLEKVNVMVPEVDAKSCNGCRKCVEFCKFNALAYIKGKLIVFPELCHACKGCVMLCPEKALLEAGREIGHIDHGTAKDIDIRTGVLNTGEATGVPIIRRLLSGLHGVQAWEKGGQEDAVKDKTVVIDCPPGSSCLVMESIKDADFCLMVAEPTSFGIHNLDMIYRLVKLFKKPHALAVNKDMGNKSLIEKYCADNNIPIIAAVPYDNRLALINSRGLVAAAESNSYRAIFEEMLKTIEKEVRNETVGHIER